MTPIDNSMKLQIAFFYHPKVHETSLWVKRLLGGEGFENKKVLTNGSRSRNSRRLLTELEILYPALILDSIADDGHAPGVLGRSDRQDDHRRVVVLPRHLLRPVGDPC